MAPPYTPHPEYHYDRDFKGYGEAGLDPKWPGRARIAVSFVINYEEGGEHSVQNGDGVSETNLRENPMGAPWVNERNHSAESEYEYGSRVGFWRLFKMFNALKMKFTLYAVAQAVEQYPEVVKRCVEEGHDIASHAYRWIDYHNMPIEQEKALIRQAVTSLKNLSGYAPRGWYYGRPSPHSRTLVPRVYAEMGETLEWMSDTYADDVPYWIDLPKSVGEAAAASSEKEEEPKPTGCLLVPYSYDCNDFKFHTAGSGFRDPDGFFQHLKNAFDVLYAEGEEDAPKMMTIGLHCRIVGRPGRFAALKQFADYVAGKEGVWVATRSEIAASFKENYPYRPGCLA